MAHSCVSLLGNSVFKLGKYAQILHQNIKAFALKKATHVLLHVSVSVSARVRVRVRVSVSVSVSVSMYVRMRSCVHMCVLF